MSDNTIPPATLQRIEAREAEVLGGPYRLSDVDREAVLDEVRQATADLRNSIVVGAAPVRAQDIPAAAIPDIMFQMQPFGELWQRIMALSMTVMGPSCDIPVRDMKLALLRTAWLIQAPFEFGEHVGQARGAGFTEEEINRICEQGSAAPEWTAHEAAILRVAEELRENAFVSDATWAEVAGSYSEKQLFELLILIGQFTTVGYFQNSLRIPLAGDNAGLKAR
ncbi:MAG: carboxymuconolactone decarboxylase family protein [Sphingomonadaceae bacterium]|jgi:alkylhydroperoxidase family enzyme